MPHIDSYWFFIIGGIICILLILGARIVFRVVLVFFALLAIWFGLHVIGLAPSPINYFNSRNQEQ